MAEPPPPPAEGASPCPAFLGQPGEGLKSLQTDVWLGQPKRAAVGAAEKHSLQLLE